MITNATQHLAPGLTVSSALPPEQWPAQPEPTWFSDEFFDQAFAYGNTAGDSSQATSLTEDGKAYAKGWVPDTKAAKSTTNTTPRGKPRAGAKKPEKALLVVAERQTKGGLDLVRAVNVRPEPVKWIWPGYVAANTLNLLEGSPGSAKSMLTCSIAAAVTTGGKWPNGARAEVGNVIMVNMEDDLARTVRPRLEAAGADLKSVFMFEGIKSGFTLDEDLDRLSKEIETRKAKLVVIDPLMAAFGARTDAHKDQHVRRVLSRLAAICGETGCGVLLVRHLKKSAGGSAINNGGGSIGIIGAARVALLLAKDPEDENVRILATVKNNLAQYNPKNSSTAWTIDHGRMEYIGISELSADELAQMQGKKQGSGPGRPDEGKLSAAKAWLSEELANGPVPSTTLIERAEAAGHSGKTLERARKDFTESHNVGGVWQVSLIPK